MYEGMDLHSLFKASSFQRRHLVNPHNLIKMSMKFQHCMHRCVNNW
jgi:hypothetical protein